MSSFTLKEEKRIIYLPLSGFWQSQRQCWAFSEWNQPRISKSSCRTRIFVEVSDAESEVGETTRWPKWKHTSQKLVLDGCLCGSVLDGSMDGVLRCKQIGCETEWVGGAYLKWYFIYWLTKTIQFHLECINLELAPQNWVCAACEASGSGRGGKRSKRWHQITIYRYMPDYVS